MKITRRLAIIAPLLRARLAAVVIGAAACPAAAATPAELIGPDLTPQPVTLHAIHDGQATYFDAQRTMRRIELDELVELVMTPVNGATPGQPTATGLWADVRLFDGQCYRGAWAGVNDVGELGVEHPRLGRLPIALDRLGLLRLHHAGQPPVMPSTTRASGMDILTLTNGDVLQGFVLSATTAGFELEPEAGAAAITVPWERLVSIQCAVTSMSAQELPTGVALLLLRDGACVAVVAVAFEAEMLTATLAQSGRRVQLPIAEVDRIAVRGPAGRMVALFDQPMTVERQAQVFGRPWPPRLETRAEPDGLGSVYDGPVLRMHAPTSLRFELPHGSARLVAMCRLDVPMAEPARRLADPIVIFSQNGRELVRQTLSADHDVQAVNLSVSSGPLVLSIEQGERGPVLDRVLIEWARLLIAP